MKREKELSVFFVEADAVGMVTFSGNSSLQSRPILRSCKTPNRLSRIICNVARLEVLAGNGFIVRCHVTSKSPIRVRTVGKKFPAT